MILDAPIWLQTAIVLCFGFCVGSFLNVVIVRLPRGRSIVKPSSRSWPWRSSLRWYENIPVLSYVFNRGMDRKSGYPYSLRYLVVEVLTALLFFAIYLHYGWSMPSLYYAAFASVLIAGSFIDLELRILPNELTLGAWAVAIGLVLLGVKAYPLTITEALLGGIFGYVLFWLLSRGYFWVTGEEGLGGGDVKWMGFIGAVIGMEGVLMTIMLASFIGAALGLVMMLVLDKSRRYPIPFGPFLACGALLYLFGINFELMDGWL